MKNKNVVSHTDQSTTNHKNARTSLHLLLYLQGYPISRKDDEKMTKENIMKTYENTIILPEKDLIFEDAKTIKTMVDDNEIELLMALHMAYTMGYAKGIEQ